jgi:hypothetical protein
MGSFLHPQIALRGKPGQMWHLEGCRTFFWIPSLLAKSFWVGRRIPGVLGVFIMAKLMKKMLKSHLFIYL